MRESTLDPVAVAQVGERHILKGQAQMNWCRERGGPESENAQGSGVDPAGDSSCSGSRRLGWIQA